MYAKYQFLCDRLHIYQTMIIDGIMSDAIMMTLGKNKRLCGTFMLFNKYRVDMDLALRLYKQFLDYWVLQTWEAQSVRALQSN